MSKHDTLIRLQDMLDHAREAVSWSRGRTRVDLDRDRVLSLAFVRLLEIVGEAASRVPHEVQDRYTNIPWAEIIGLRNRLIHAYGAIDLDVVWSIIANDLPSLVTVLEQVIEKEK